MADRSISIRLSARVDGLVAGFKTAQKAASDFGSQTQKFAQDNRQSLEQVGQAGMVMGGVLAAGFGLAVNKFSQFDKAMSGVQAATHESAENMELLRDAAVDAGAETAYSAEEAAGAIEELAKAGVSTADILGGGLDGALSLAAAGSLEVGVAAELAATSMTQFGLSGKDIPHIADLLAAGAGKAQGSVEDMGMALKQAGLVADQTGLTIEETTGGLAAFASAGLVGSDAGTSFKSMLQRLTPSSKEAADLMGELGISAYDAQGNFIGLSEFAGNLKTSMADLTVEQRNSAMSTIFGSDAVRAAAILYENGAAGVQKWEDAVNDAGFAAETAAIKQDNLAGDLEKLGGAFDTVLLKSGSGANAFLRDSVQGLEGLVDAVGRIPAPVLSASAAIAGIGGAALLAAGGVATFLPRALETVGAFRDLQSSSPGVARGMTQVGRAAAGAAVIGTFGAVLGEVVNHFTQQGIDAGAGKIAKAIAEIGLAGEEASARLDELFSKTDGGDLTTEVNSLDEALKRTFDPGLMQKQIDVMQGVGKVLSFGTAKTELNTLGDAFDRLDSQLADTVGSGNAEAAAASFDVIKERAAGLGIGVDELNTRFPKYVDSLAAADAAAIATTGSTDPLVGALGAVGGAAAATTPMTEELAKAFEEVGLSASGAVVNVAAFTEYLVNSGLLTLSARDATRAYEEAIDAAAESALTAAGAVDVLTIGANGNAVGFNNTTAAGRAAEASFDAVASSGIRAAQAVAEHTQSEVETQAALSGTYQSLLVAANGFGITGGQADALARSVMGIPPEANIDSWFSEAAAQKVAELNGALSSVDGRRVSTYADHYETTHKMVVVTEKNQRVGVGQVGLRAAGGAIYGPGTGTSDTAGLYALSNGEHVLTAREVSLMGGQGAVYDFRSQLKAGLKGYADGGAVMRSKSVAAGNAMYASGGPVTASVDTRGMEEAVSRGLSGASISFNVGTHRFAGVIEEVQRKAARR